MATLLSRQSDTREGGMQSVSHIVYDTSATCPEKQKHPAGKRKLSESSSSGKASPQGGSTEISRAQGSRHGDVTVGRTHGRRSSDSSAGVTAFKRADLMSASVKRSESCSSPSTRMGDKAVVKRSPVGTITTGYGNSQFYAKTGILPVMDTGEKLENRHSGIRRVSRLHECGIRFPKLEECAHFHYEHVELPVIKVSVCDEKEEDVVYRQGNRDDVEHCFIIKVTSGDRNWLVRRTYENFRLLDRQLHKCIYDRKYSNLPELKPTDKVFENGILPLQKMLGLYLGRLSTIAGNMLNCGPILSWLEMDNRGNRLIVTDESAINTPAIAAAHVIRRYQSMAADEVSMEVGDIVSVIDMPPPEDTIWWRGKRGFEVGYFPCECVEVIGDKVPQSMESRIPPLKPVLRKRGKLISFLRTFFSTRPTRNTLKRSGIVKERVFGCDLGEHLLNSGHDVPLVLKTCAEVIESHGIVDGIYRLSGVASNIHRLRNEFDEDKIPDLTSESSLQDVHSVSSLLKMYFRELPNPLLTYQLYDKFAAAVQEEEENRLMKIHDVIQQLPPPHYRTTEYLINHLSRVAAHGKDTGMHCKNLAIVWAPNLLRSKELETACSAAALQGVGIQAVVTEFLIKYADLIFSDKLPTFSSISDAGTPRKSRPKSLAISTPTKLLSLEEARERAMSNAASSQHDQKYIEVGGGPSSLPATYHTVIDLPHKKKGRKTGKSPAMGWKAFFSRNRESNAKVKAKVAEMRLSKTEKALTEDDVANRRRLRTAKSADSLLSSTRTSMVGNRLSNASDSTTIINPYADKKDATSPEQRLQTDALIGHATVYSNHGNRRGSLHSDSDFEMEDLSPLDENFFMIDSLMLEPGSLEQTDGATVGSDQKQQFLDELQSEMSERSQRGAVWTSPSKRHIQRSQSADVPLRTFCRSRSFQGGELSAQLVKEAQLGRSPSWGPGRYDNRRSGMHVQKMQFDSQSYPAKRSKGERGQKRRGSGKSSPAASLSPSDSPRRQKSSGSPSRRLAASYSPTHLKSALGVAVADRQAVSLSPTHLKALLNSPTYDGSMHASSSPASDRSPQRSPGTQSSEGTLRSTGAERSPETEWLRDRPSSGPADHIRDDEVVETSLKRISQLTEANVRQHDDDIQSSDQDGNAMRCSYGSEGFEELMRFHQQTNEAQQMSDSQRFGDMTPIQLSSSPGATRKLVSRLSQDYDDYSDEDDNICDAARTPEQFPPCPEDGKTTGKLSPRWTPEGKSTFSTIWEDGRYDQEADYMQQKFSHLSMSDHQKYGALAELGHTDNTEEFPRSISVPSDIQRSVDNLDDMTGSQSDMFASSYQVSEASKSLDSLLCERLAGVSEEDLSSHAAHQVSLPHDDPYYEDDGEHVVSSQFSLPQGGSTGHVRGDADERCENAAARFRKYSGSDNYADSDNDSDNASRSALLGSQYSVSTQSSCTGSDVSDTCHTWPPLENYTDILAGYHDNSQQESRECDMMGDEDYEGRHLQQNVMVRDSCEEEGGSFDYERDEDVSVDLSRSELQAIHGGDFFCLGNPEYASEPQFQHQRPQQPTNDLNKPDSQSTTRYRNRPSVQAYATDLEQKRDTHNGFHVYYDEGEAYDPVYCGEEEEDDDGVKSDEECYSDDSIEESPAERSDERRSTRNDDVMYTQPGDVMYTQPSDVIDTGASAAGDIVDLVEDYPHGGYIPHGGLYSQFQESESDSDNENVDQVLPSRGDFVNCDEFSTGGYLPHRDFSDSWTEEDGVDMFSASADNLSAVGLDVCPENMADKYDDSADFGVPQNVTQTAYNPGGVCSEELVPPVGQFENPPQAETGRIVIRKATTHTVQKVAVVQPSRQMACTALPPGAKPATPPPQPKPSATRQQQFRRPPPPPETFSQQRATGAGWSHPRGVPPQVVSSPVEESSSDSSETDDMTASAGSLDMYPRCPSARNTSQQQQNKQPAPHWPLNMDDHKQPTPHWPLNMDDHNVAHWEASHVDHQFSQFVSPDVDDASVGGDMSIFQSKSDGNVGDKSCSQSWSAADAHKAYESVHQEVPQRPLPGASSLKEPKSSSVSSRKHNENIMSKSDASANLPKLSDSTDDRVMEASIDGNKQRKASIKELRSRFESQSEERPPSQCSDVESKPRPPIFQKPRILRMHSLSPTTAEPPSGFGSTDSIGSGGNAQRPWDKSSHSSKESLTFDQKRGSDAGSFSSRESLDSDQTRCNRMKVDGSKSGGVSQLKSRFESCSSDSGTVPSVRPRVTKRRGQEGRPGHLDLFSSWESRSSEKSPSSEREVFSDTSENEARLFPPNRRSQDGALSSQVETRNAALDSQYHQLSPQQGAHYQGEQSHGRSRYRFRISHEEDKSPTWTSIV